MKTKTVIEFDRVSKRFRLEKSRPDSFLEALASVFRVPQESQEFWVLRNVSFDIRPGEFVGLIGSNGAGKSTVLKMIARIIEPTSGSIDTRGRVGALLELGAGFHPELTGRENVYLSASLIGLDRRYIDQCFDEIVEFSGLEEFIDVPVKHYSSGMYVRLGFSVAVHIQPDILLIDEVLAVGDESFRHKCMDRIARLRRSGVTILLVSHSLGVVESMCDRVIWIENGDIVLSGDPTDVVRAYLNKIAEEERTANGIEAPIDDQSRRWGNRLIEITGVEIGGSADDNIIRTGGSLQIDIHYICEREVRDPVFGIAVHYQSGVHVTGPNTKFAGLSIPAVEGQGTIRYVARDLNLLEGRYDLTVSVVSSDMTENYDYQDRAYSFRVHRGSCRERFGLVTLDGEWFMD